MGCRDLGEALRRIGEGAALIRTKGEAGSGNIVEAVRHMREVQSKKKQLTKMDEDELMAAAKDLGAPFSLVQQVSNLGKLPVPNFAAGGVATPADASLMMQLGAETVFVGSGIFKSEDPASRAHAIVEAVSYYQDSKKLLKVSTGLKPAMKGLDISEIPEDQLLQERGLGMKIGILALQGDFDKHRLILEQLDLEPSLVRYPSDLNHISGLIIPGGESTTMTKLMDSTGFYESITSFANTNPVLGTCAGVYYDVEASQR
ncbi:MAG: hypothetical protein Ct9H300mP29_5910 [Candidatus Neomarinimicrobiota bacterium]|nr:MAG: hypothetical protein Ct9H300mP29_5910 [Candidatus Neomarinimicrobiota bacterium]